LKDSSLVSYTGFVRELLWRAQRVGRSNFRNLEALLVAAFFYWILTLIFTAIQARVEASFEQGEGKVGVMSH
jgi:polar amino acid transport system permease protein